MDYIYIHDVYDSQNHFLNSKSLCPFHLESPSPTEVYSIKWYMGHFGHPSQKPERGWTNNAYFEYLDLGPWKRKGKGPSSASATYVKKTINKVSGKKGYCGTHALKSSQSWT